jgi:hypothetical protein
MREDRIQAEAVVNLFSGWSMARPTDPHVLEDGVGIPDKALVHMRASGELTRKLHP